MNFLFIIKPSFIDELDKATDNNSRNNDQNILLVKSTDNNSPNSVDEEEFDVDGVYANKQAQEIRDDINLVRQAKRGDHEAKEKIRNSRYGGYEGDLDKLEKMLEHDYVQEKNLRDRENLKAGRPVTPDLELETKTDEGNLEDGRPDTPDVEPETKTDNGNLEGGKSDTPGVKPETDIGSKTQENSGSMGWLEKVTKWLESL